MDEQAIRQWAWNETRGWYTSSTDGDGKEIQKPWTLEYRLARADALAAWVMSGKLPEPVEPNP